MAQEVSPFSVASEEARKLARSTKRRSILVPTNKKKNTEMKTFEMHFRHLSNRLLDAPSSSLNHGQV